MNDFLELTQGLIEKNDFEETEFQPLPNGEYRVKVANVEKKTSQSGKRRRLARFCRGRGISL